MHYLRAWRKKPRQPKAKAKKSPHCSVAGCSRPNRARGMCKKHYDQDWFRRNPPCFATGCQRKSFARGLCQMHYKREERAAMRQPGKTGKSSNDETHIISALDFAITTFPPPHNLSAPLIGGPSYR